MIFLCFGGLIAGYIVTFWGWYKVHNEPILRGTVIGLNLFLAAAYIATAYAGGDYPAGDLSTGSTWQDTACLYALFHLPFTWIAMIIRLAVHTYRNT